MPGKMDCFGQTDRGHKRASNEDHFLIADLNKALRIHQTSLDFDDEETLFGKSQGMMLLVADGMGGHAAGEHASRLTVESLTSSILNNMPWFFSRDAEGDEDLRAALERGAASVPAAAAAGSPQSPQPAGHGHDADGGLRSLAPRDRDPRRRQSLLSPPRRSTPAGHAGPHRGAADGGGSGVPVERHPAQPLGQRSLERHRQRDTAVKPEVHQFDLQIGDVLLLSTDGLTRHVEAPEIQQYLQRNLAAQPTCQLLIDAALSRGGLDNITAVIAKFVDEHPQSQRLEAIAEKSIATELSDTVPEMPAITQPAEEIEVAPVMPNLN